MGGVAVRSFAKSLPQEVAMNETLKDASVQLMLGGDVMLGRLVGEEMALRGPGYPLGGVAPLLREADLAIVNLECAITDATEEWRGAPKAFYFGAPPEAAQALADAGVDCVTLANNHILDFNHAGLRDTLRLLRQHGIGYAGAGADLDEACAPLFFARNGIKFGMVAFCDHQEDFAAGAHAPGMAYLDLTDEAAALAAFRRGLAHIAKGRADWPLLSLHWGPNWAQRPSHHFTRLAHAAIDMGYRILFGHSAHVFQGVELYRGCPILYAAGDLVDDYYVDPAQRNDHQLLFELELTRAALRGIRLHPVLIDDCRVALAKGEQFDHIAQRATALCAEMGTKVQRTDGRLAIACGG
jgi:poly-gamma-glutamate capsule biosynthesis protein CapA/YwtB (metallophosphatase superfamily)